MCHNLLLGFHVVRSTVSTRYLWPQSTVDAAARIERAQEHTCKVQKYPDAQYYMNEVRRYMFRNADLRHLKATQVFRYVSHEENEVSKKAPAMRTDEDTSAEEDEGAITDDQCHWTFDLQCSRVGAGLEVKCAKDLKVEIPSAKIRHNRDLCVVRSAFLEQCGKDRDAFYEQKLLLRLPWHCYRKPFTGNNNQHNNNQPTTNRPTTNHLPTNNHTTTNQPTANNQPSNNRPTANTQPTNN